MSRFRKKPVVIEARLFDMGDYDEALDVVRWCGGRAVTHGCEIDTLEGRMIASQGDWIIRGIQGEFYACKPDIFAASYELVDEQREVADHLFLLADIARLRMKLDGRGAVHLTRSAAARILDILDDRAAQVSSRPPESPNHD